MTVQTGTYSFLDVNATISGDGGNFSIKDAGLSDEAISISQTADKNTMMVGAAGDGMHSLRASTAVRVTISLLKTAIGNAQLNGLYRHQSVSSARWGKNTITITNAVTGDAIVCTGCAFVKQTDLGYKSEGGLNVWAFDCIASQQILGDSFLTTGGV
jgi:dTDP-4-amino-4,6-dideoxygalactose transaminase